jgi:hypothetical protein
VAYQDYWIRGAVTARGDRECQARYAIIRDVVAEYQRPVTVLDLGANLGYFGCRLAHEFGAVSVMVDRRRELIESCASNDLPTTIALQRTLTVADLRELAACEHIDVVLALNVLHHLPDWRGALDALLQIGEQIIIETPSRDDRGSCRFEAARALLDAIERERPETIGSTESHVTAGVRRPLFRLVRGKRHLTKGYVYGERHGAPAVRAHTIRSTRDDKTVQYADGESRDWHPGINLQTWSVFGGVWPRPDVVRAAVTQASNGHGDIRPWNFILQGATVVPIDTDHRRRRGGPEALAETLRSLPEATWPSA